MRLVLCLSLLLLLPSVIAAGDSPRAVSAAYEGDVTYLTFECPPGSADNCVIDPQPHQHPAYYDCDDPSRRINGVCFGMQGDERRFSITVEDVSGDDLRRPLLARFTLTMERPSDRLTWGWFCGSLDYEIPAQYLGQARHLIIDVNTPEDMVAQQPNCAMKAAYPPGGSNLLPERVGGVLPYSDGGVIHATFYTT